MAATSRRERLLNLIRIRIDGRWYQLSRRRPGFYLPVLCLSQFPYKIQRLLRRIDEKLPWCWWPCDWSRPDTHTEP
jgi:hypothetical protein